jgi:type VI protein secretion system component VasF
LSPETARVVDPVFLAVLDFVDRFERGQLRHYETERNSIRKLIDEGDQTFGGNSEVWQLSKYALVSFIDEQYTSLPWSGKDSWTNNSLEYLYFFAGRGEAWDTKGGYEQFFIEARKAATLPNKDALEVFVTCVLLGFRGMYGKPVDPSTASRLGVPNNLKDWLRNMSGAGLVSSHVANKFQSAPERGDGARPLDGKSQLITMGFLGTSFLIIAICYWYFFFGNVSW